MVVEWIIYKYKNVRGGFSTSCSKGCGGRRLMVLVATVLLAVLFTACAGAAGTGGKTGKAAREADNYPAQPITYMIPFDAGGQSDVEARRQQPLLKKLLGQQVNVTYKPGGGGAVGWAELVQQKADGYYIAGINVPHIILQPLAQQDAGYETEQIEPIAIFQTSPIGLAVTKESGITSLEEFVQAAKKEPGKLTVAGSGSYSGHHLAFGQLQQLADIELQYVPFTGGATQIQGFLGGNTTAILANSDDLVSYKGKMTILAIGSEERFAALPDVPTFQEGGFNLTASIDRGVAVPPGTPSEIVARLEAAFLEIANDPKVQKEMQKDGFAPQAMGAAEAKQYIAEKKKQYEPVLESLDALMK